MKHILILSENDSVASRLNQLADQLFNFETKQIYLCTLHFVDCRIMSYQYPGIYKKKEEAETPEVVARLASAGYTARFNKRFTASGCDDIINIIKGHHIDCILMPIFINEDSYWQYYRAITAEIRKQSTVEVIGLMI